ncbi:MAG: IS66 family insertion sequence element accessory protein TnpB [Bacteroidetes bacterium]|nr:IS66 family insertion sequence element accessory protein TnpB [Bacteroidota bacterium]
MCTFSLTSHATASKARWEPGGFVLFYKRLEQGRLQLPKQSMDGVKNQMLDYSQLVMIINGISMENARKTSDFIDMILLETKV